MNFIQHFIFKQKKSYISQLLIAASIVFLFLAPLTYHPDSKMVLNWAGQDQGKVWNIWQYGAENFPDEAQFNYPPFHFYFDKLQYFIAKPLAGAGFDAWLGTEHNLDQFEPNLVRFSFAMKAGLLIFYLASGYLVYLIVRRESSEQKALWAAGLWLLNPITLYSIPMMGQNDVMAITFFLLGWLLLPSKKIWAVLAFGVGTSIKMFPLIWLPFLLAARSDLTWKEKFLLCLGTLGFYIATLLPFLSTPNFRESVLTGNLNERFLYAQLTFGFPEAINIVPLLLLFVLLAAMKQRKIYATSISATAFLLMTVNALMLGFSHFHPQWWSWVACFWAIWLVSVESKKIGAAVMLSVISFLIWLVIVVLFQDAALSWGIVSPLNPYLQNMPVIRDFLLLKGMNILMYLNLAQTWLAGIGCIGLALLFSAQFPDIHEQIKLPLWLSSLQTTLGKTKWLRVSVSVVTLVSVLLFSLIAAHSVPAPATSVPPTDLQYRELLQPFQTTVTLEHGQWYRFDLYLTNKEFSSTELFSVTVTTLDGVHVMSQNIAASNIGDLVKVRFDLPPQPFNPAVQYRIRIAPEHGATQKESSISVGVTSDQAPTDSLAVQTYYDVHNEKTLSQRLTERAHHIASQIWPVYILIICLVFLL